MCYFESIRQKLGLMSEYGKVPTATRKYSALASHIIQYLPEEGSTRGTYLHIHGGAQRTTPRNKPFSKRLWLKAATTTFIVC